MSDLLAEVDEAMRQERVEKFFKEHGKTVLAFIVLTIVMTGAISAYKHWDKNAREQGTTNLMLVLEDPSFPENIKTAELDMRGGLRGMALLSAGGAFLESGNSEDALATYKRAAEDNGIPNDLQQLAQIIIVRLDKSEGAEPVKALKPIWSDKGSPWRYHARLEAATILANTQSDFGGALDHLKAIAEAEGLPDTLYNKARALSHVYALKQQQAQKTAAETPAKPDQDS